MAAPTHPTRPDPTRTGAVWVTGTGAFLLLASAAVFVAVRWSDIPPSAKLGAISLLTGGFLLAGRRLHESLPATAGALFHLGAFLVPIDVAAVGVRIGLDWPRMLLAEGLAAAATFAWAAHTERSVVLRWSAGIAVVVTAAGIGANSALPAPLVLSVFAATALVARRDDAAIAWAGAAGFGPVVTFAERLAFDGAGTLERLGLTGHQPRVAAVATGVIAASVLAVAGRRRDDIGLALIGGLVAATGVAATWTGIAPEAIDTVLGLAATFLFLELVGLHTRRDPFWRIPASVVAAIAEVGAAAGTFVALGIVLVSPLIDQPDARAALAVGVLTVGWATADARRGRTRGWGPSTVGCSVAAAATVALATASGPAVGLTLVAVAAAAVLLDRSAGHAVAAIAATFAPVAAMDLRAAAAVAGFVGATVIAEAAVRRSHAARPETPDGATVDDATAGPADAPWANIEGSSSWTDLAAAQRSRAAEARRAGIAEGWSWMLAIASLAPLAIAASVISPNRELLAATLVATAIGATVAAAILDRATLPLGVIARLGSLAVLSAARSLRPTEIGLVALAVAALSIVDAVRLTDPRVALGAAIAGPVAVGALCHGAGLSVPASGAALTLGAAVIAGLGSLLDKRWELPVRVAALVAAIAGLVVAAPDPPSFGSALIVVGGIFAAAAITMRELDVAFIGGVVMTSGLWIRLAHEGIAVSEPYIAPVALLLVLAGLRARASGASSWLAYAPAVAVLGGSALAERLGGGAGWHALVAGAVGVLAVGIGGTRRLAGPLLLGTSLLVALAGYETLAITATFPTWVWLALGGTALLCTGVAMERADVGPIESGRRLVDVVSDRFE